MTEVLNHEGSASNRRIAGGASNVPAPDAGADRASARTVTKISNCEGLILAEPRSSPMFVVPSGIKSSSPRWRARPIVVHTQGSFSETYVAGISAVVHARPEAGSSGDR